MSDRKSSVGLEGGDKSSIEWKINKQQIEQRKRETKALLAWSNTFLKERSMQANSIVKDFSDGVLLINLVEVAFSASLGNYKLRPQLPFHKHENLNLAFEYLEKTMGVMLLGIDSHQILGQSEKQVINVLWSILRCLTMRGLVPGDHKKANVRDTLLGWIKQTDSLSALGIKDFWDSWKDGVAFCHIVDRLCPGHIDTKNLDPNKSVENLQLAFRVAEEQLGIPSLLQPEDFAADQKPNEQAVMNYVCMLISTANTLAKKNQDLHAMQATLEKKKKEELAKFEEMQAKKDAELAEFAEEKRKNEAAVQKMEQRMEEIRQLQMKSMAEEANVKEKLAMTESEKKQREDQIAQQMELFKSLQSEMLAQQEQAKQFLEKREQDFTEERNALLKIIEELRAQLTDSEQRVSDLTARNLDLQSQLYDAFREHQEVVENFQAEMKRSTLKERVNAAAHKDDYEKLLQEAMLSQKTFKDFIKALPEKNGWLFKARPDAKLKGHVFQPRYFGLKGDTVFYSKDKDAKGKDVKSFSLEHYQLISRSNTLGSLKLSCWYDAKKGQLNFTVVGAADLKGLGSNGKSDPFVEVRIMPPDQDKTKRRRSMIVAVKEALTKAKPLATTKVITGTLNPVWDESFNSPMDEERVRTSWLEFDVMDKSVLSDELIGKVVVDLSTVSTAEENANLDWIELRKVNSKNGSQIIQLLPRDVADTKANKEKDHSKILEISSMVEIEDQGGEKKVGWYMRQWNARKTDLDDWVDAINSRISLISYLGQNYQQRMARGGREFVSFICTPDASLLKIENKIIDVEGCLEHLLEPLAFRPNLRIELKNVGLNDAGARIIAEILKGSKTLQSIDLAQNQITATGVGYLAEAMRHNHSMHSLNLDENAIGDEGASELARSLAESPQVRTCSLRGCGIGDFGCSALAKALASGDSVHMFPALELSYNAIGDEACRDIADLVEKNPTLTSLQLDHNVIADPGVAHLVTVLAKPTCNVTECRLSHNNVSSEGVIKLALVFKNTSGRFSCDLSGNALISKKGVAAVLATEVSIDFKLLHLVRNQQGSAASPRGMEVGGKSTALTSPMFQNMSLNDFLKPEGKDKTPRGVAGLAIPTPTAGAVRPTASPSSSAVSSPAMTPSAIKPKADDGAAAAAAAAAEKAKAEKEKENKAIREAADKAAADKVAADKAAAKEAADKEKADADKAAAEKAAAAAAANPAAEPAAAAKPLTKEEEKAKRKAELKRQQEELEREIKEQEAREAADKAKKDSEGPASPLSSPKDAAASGAAGSPTAASRARGGSSVKSPPPKPGHAKNKPSAGDAAAAGAGSSPTNAASPSTPKSANKLSKQGSKLKKGGEES